MRSRTRTTRVPLIDVSTSIASDSRVKSSTTLNVRMRRPLCNVSCTKSEDHCAFGRDAGVIASPRPSETRRFKRLLAEYLGISVRRLQDIEDDGSALESGEPVVYANGNARFRGRYTHNRILTKSRNMAFTWKSFKTLFTEDQNRALGLRNHILALANLISPSRSSSRPPPCRSSCAAKSTYADCFSRSDSLTVPLDKSA